MPPSLLRPSRRAGPVRPSRAVRAETHGRRAGTAGAGRARARRALAALLAAAAVLGVGRLALARPVAGSEPVVVASAQVAAGTTLSAAVVEVRHLPGDVIPAGAVRDPALVVGRPAASVLSPGEVLTEHDVGSGALLVGQGPEVRAVFVPVPEAPVLAALTAGDRVDLHSPVDGTVVAADLLVLAVPGEVGGGWTPALGTARAAGEPGGVWVATDGPTAVRVAAARGADPAGAALMVSLRSVRP